MTDAPQTTSDADINRLTSRDPDLDHNALEAGHTVVLDRYRAAALEGRAQDAAMWEAVLVASGYGWPQTPKEALAHGR